MKSGADGRKSRNDMCVLLGTDFGSVDSQACVCCPCLLLIVRDGEHLHFHHTHPASLSVGPHQINSGVVQPQTAQLPHFSAYLPSCALAATQLSLQQASHTSKSPFLPTLNSFKSLLPCVFRHPASISLPSHSFTR